MSCHQNYKERMQTNSPRAEEQLDIELQNRKLLRYCHSKGTTILFFGNGKFLIVPKEKMLKGMISQCDGFTIPDRIIKDIPIYLDGEPHLKRGVKNRDDRIDKKLRDCGLEPQRFSYKGKLSKQRLDEICCEIERMVKT